ncbi:Hypothetical predicted protein [Paramuricea clavata]|uniref:Uncharacterized protein n=1 Tax=Paramuricea clavata TaxID=317549 RepID=A0A6S7HKC1_PARCT|nr:Hypothetical predicted protein [Paramuricea clavata]
MAVHFYRELNNLSTADFLIENKKRKGKFYKVERIISRRTRKRKAEYLVKWSGYGSLENSWEPEENLNAFALRALFKDQGVETEDGRHILLEKNDFQRCHLPEQWDQILDQLGNGIKIAFPVNARPFISQSTKTYRVICGKLVNAQIQY